MHNWQESLKIWRFQFWPWMLKMIHFRYLWKRFAKICLSFRCNYFFLTARRQHSKRRSSQHRKHCNHHYSLWRAYWIHGRNITHKVHLFLESQHWFSENVFLNDCIIGITSQIVFSSNLPLECFKMNTS